MTMYISEGNNLTPPFVPDSTVPSTASRQHAALRHALSELRGCACHDCASERDELRRINDGLDKLREAVKPIRAIVAMQDARTEGKSLYDGEAIAYAVVGRDLRNLLTIVAQLLGNTGEEHGR